MDRRTIEGTFYGILAAAGFSAVIGAFALPTASLYFNVLIYAGVAGLAVGAAGLFWLWWTAPRKLSATSPDPQKEQSTSVRASGSAKIDLEDFDSSADNLLDAKESSTIFARRVRHKPTKD
jgi:hypothetical protein